MSPAGTGDQRRNGLVVDAKRLGMGSCEGYQVGMPMPGGIWRFGAASEMHRSPRWSRGSITRLA